MKTAILNLNETTFSGYNLVELEKNWRKYSAVNLWLKVRRFDLSLPIFVTSDYEENTITFSQSESEVSRNVVVVHPNPDILSQLTNSLVKAGHQVVAFKKVKDANQELDLGHEIDSMVVPANLKIGPGCTYKDFLNLKFPNLNVLTVDKKNYRETLNLREI